MKHPIAATVHFKLIMSNKKAEEVAKQLGLTTQQFNDLKETFSYFDQNGDGNITISELQQAFQKLGITNKSLFCLFFKGTTQQNKNLKI